MTRKEITLAILPGGEIEAIYDDVLLFAGFGTISVERFATVEFDEARRLWVAKDKTGVELCSHPSREECLKLEHALAEAWILKKNS